MEIGTQRKLRLGDCVLRGELAPSEKEAVAGFVAERAVTLNKLARQLDKDVAAGFRAKGLTVPAGASPYAVMLVMAEVAITNRVLMENEILRLRKRIDDLEEAATTPRKS